MSYFVCSVFPGSAEADVGSGGKEQPFAGYLCQEYPYQKLSQVE